MRPSTLIAERGGPMVRVRGSEDGQWRTVSPSLRPSDSMIGQLADPRDAPELLLLRERMRSWRFYDHVRTDSAAPARQARVGTRTMVMSHDGGDLAAAWQTIAEIGDHAALRESVQSAFPGSRVQVTVHDGRFELTLHQPGMLRPLNAAELSDGTLRYLLWVAALLAPRPAELTVLNEPEASLHPELLPALAALIGRATETSQIIVVTHSARLVSALGEYTDVALLPLTKRDGETLVEGQGLLDEPAWHWPERG